MEISNSIGRGFQEMISKDGKDRIERRQYELSNFIYYGRPLEISPAREFWATEETIFRVIIPSLAQDSKWLLTDSSSVIGWYCFGEMNSTFPACLSSGWSCTVGACHSRPQSWRWEPRKKSRPALETAPVWASCCCSVAKSRPTLFDPMDCSTPGLPVPHHLPKFAQVHVHWLGDNKPLCLLSWKTWLFPPSLSEVSCYGWFYGHTCGRRNKCKFWHV